MCSHTHLKPTLSQTSHLRGCKIQLSTQTVWFCNKYYILQQADMFCTDILTVENTEGVNQSAEGWFSISFFFLFFPKRSSKQFAQRNFVSMTTFLHSYRQKLKVVKLRNQSKLCFSLLFWHLSFCSLFFIFMS